MEVVPLEKKEFAKFAFQGSSVMKKILRRFWTLVRLLLQESIGEQLPGDIQYLVQRSGGQIGGRSICNEEISEHNSSITRIGQDYFYNTIQKYRIKEKSAIWI
jgi:hypothetical protein